MQKLWEYLLKKAGFKIVNNCPSCGSPNKRQVELEEG